MNDTGHMTLGQAGALTEIIRAVHRKAAVAYLDGTVVTHGKAHYIGGNPARIRDFAAEGSADVRDLYLVVKTAPEPGANAVRDTYRGWLIRNLIPAYRLGTFTAEFSLAAYEAGGGQPAVTAQECADCGTGTGPERLTRWETGEPDLDTWYACARCGVLLCDACDLAGRPRLRELTSHRSELTTETITDQETAQWREGGQIPPYGKHFRRESVSYTPGLGGRVYVLKADAAWFLRSDSTSKVWAIFWGPSIGEAVTMGKPLPSLTAAMAKLLDGIEQDFYQVTAPASDDIKEG